MTFLLLNGIPNLIAMWIDRVVKVILKVVEVRTQSQSYFRFLKPHMVQDPLESTDDINEILIPRNFVLFNYFWIFYNFSHNPNSKT